MDSHKKLICAAYFVGGKYYVGWCHKNASDKYLQSKNVNGANAKGGIDGYFTEDGRFIESDSEEALDYEYCFGADKFLNKTNTELGQKYADEKNAIQDAGSMPKRKKSEMTITREFVNASSKYDEGGEIYGYGSRK